MSFLIVGSIFAGAVAFTGTASAETVSASVTSSNAEYVAMDWSEVTGDVHVEIRVSPDLSDGETLVYNETVNAANYGDTPAYRNSKAYDTVNITVSGTGVPSSMEIDIGSNFSRLDWRAKHVFTSSGGDRGFTCNPGESLAQAVNPAIEITDCNKLPVAGSVDDTVDTKTTKEEIYHAGAAEYDANQNIQQMLKNRLQDTETVALVKGKSAYVRSLNNAGSESVAEANAKENISDYYSTMEHNYLDEWNSAIEEIEYLRNVQDGDPDISDDFVDHPTANKHGNLSDDGSYMWRINVMGTGSKSYTLQNGTATTVNTIDIRVSRMSSSGGSWENHTWTMAPTTGEHNDVYPYDGSTDNSDGTYPDIWKLRIEPLTSDYDEQAMVYFGNYSNRLAEIDQQTISAHNQMETVVNQTYDQYETGQINESDLIDPYVMQNEFSPGDEYQSWSATTLALLGTNQPTDLSMTGYMNITLEDGTELQGVVQSAENPPSGEFAVNETYDPSNVNGSQWITTEDSVRELEQNFTINEIRTTDGESRTNFTIVQKNYTTSDTQDLSKLYDELNMLREELDARQTNVNGGAGGAVLGDLSSTQLMVLLALAGVGALMARDRGNNGGNNGGNGRSRY